MARRKSRDTVTTAAAPARASRSSRRWLAVGGVIVAAGVAAWWLAGFAVSRVAVQRLPVLPERATLPQAAFEQLEAADRAARATGSAAAIGELAMTYHANVRPAEALAAYAAAAIVAPRDGRFPYYRGLLLIEQADHASAIAALRAVPDSSPYHALAQLQLGEALAKTGEVDGARRALQSAAARSTSLPPIDGLPPRRGGTVAAHAAFALARLDGGGRPLPADPPPLIDPLMDAVATRSRHPDFLLKHAALAGRGGDLPWREWLARRAVDAQPGSLDVLLEMAAALQEKGAHQEALTFLQRAEAVAPGDHHTLVEQGQSLIDLGRLDEAERVLRRATRVRDASAEYNLATVLDARDRWDEARQHYQRALDINPYHARALNNLGIGLSRSGQASGAIALFERAIAVTPNDPDPYVNLSGALAGLGRLDDALAAVDRALQLAPRRADAHNNRGIFLAQLNRPGQAREAFTAALRIDPKHAEARRNLALLDGRQ